MKFIQPFLEVVFPVTCVCCGSSVSGRYRHICYWCSGKRFEGVNSDEKLLLPQKVRFVWSMWQFDKGGALQDLLHNLKYNYLKGVGLELGYLAGRKFLDEMDADTLQMLDAVNPMVVPVPLHRAKQRKRGYNQARALGEGLVSALGWEMCDEQLVQRTRKTRTQTGLNTGQRSKNMKEVFQVRHRDQLEDRFTVIVDDVFTTGATTFELASTLCSDGMNCGIITIARA